jgi:hypothetical protein
MFKSLTRAYPLLGRIERERMAMAARGEQPEVPTVEDLLNDPSTSFWLRNALTSALLRDPVDAANDAEILARVLDQQCRLILGQDS